MSDFSQTSDNHYPPDQPPEPPGGKRRKVQPNCVDVVRERGVRWRNLIGAEAHQRMMEFVRVFEFLDNGVRLIAVVGADGSDGGRRVGRTTVAHCVLSFLGHAVPLLVSGLDAGDKHNLHDVWRDRRFPVLTEVVTASLPTPEEIDELKHDAGLLVADGGRNGFGRCTLSASVLVACVSDHMTPDQVDAFAARVHKNKRGGLTVLVVYSCTKRAPDPGRPTPEQLQTKFNVGSDRVFMLPYAPAIRSIIAEGECWMSFGDLRRHSTALGRFSVEMLALINAILKGCGCQRRPDDLFEDCLTGLDERFPAGVPAPPPPSRAAPEGQDQRNDQIDLRRLRQLSPQLRHWCKLSDLTPEQRGSLPRRATWDAEARANAEDGEGHSLRLSRRARQYILDFTFGGKVSKAAVVRLLLVHLAALPDRAIRDLALRWSRVLAPNPDSMRRRRARNSSGGVRKALSFRETDKIAPELERLRPLLSGWNLASIVELAIAYQAKWDDDGSTQSS